MRVKLVKIGNSWGIRLPKTVITECELKDDVELLVHEKTILLTAVASPRKSWAEALEREAGQKTLDVGEEWKW
ncbi:MAG: hypothetical protein LBU87_02030 [Lactobacillales bacterium]|jgi:antitoxin MazE|nr:hypothetical protein [Lactobacillales bacterium]